MGTRRPFPSPGVLASLPTTRAALRPLPSRVRSPAGLAVRGHGRWGPACPWGASRPGCEPPRPGRAGQMNGWWTAGGSRGGFLVVVEGSRVGLSAVGGAGAARRERRLLEVLCAWKARPGVPGVAGPPLCVCGGGIPALFTRWARSRSVPCLSRCPLSAVAPGTFPSRCANTLLDSCVRDPLPGGHSPMRHTHLSPVGVFAGRAPRTGHPAVRVSPLGPHPPHRWWLGGRKGVGGVPGPGGLLSGPRCCRRAVLWCVCV